jgi:hypothetical protein
VFGVAIFVSGDIWRRACLGVQHLGCMALLDMPLEDGIQFIKELLAQYEVCPKCLDSGLATVIVQMFSDLHQINREQLSKRYSDLQSLLEDIATFCPISSDLVECRNGLVVNHMHRYRGRMLHTRSSAETSYLTGIVRGFKALVDVLKPYFLPPQVGHMLKMVGDRRNSKKKTEKREKAERLQDAQTRKIRKLSGYL